MNKGRRMLQMRILELVVKLEFVLLHQDLVQLILVTGIATADMDSIPMIVVTGQVGRAFIGTDAFQEVDIL